MQVRDVMTHEVVTVDPGTSAREAARLMVAGGLAALRTPPATGT
jgi:CBS domain-containing protein